MDLFCLEAVPGWIERVKSYLDALDEGVDVHLVSYDQLLRQTETVLSDTLRWLGIPHTDATVAQAASNTQFSKLQAAEAKTLGGKIPFFRRGREGSGGLELKPETLSKIRDATAEMFARANKSLARQAAATQAALEESSRIFSPKANSRNGHAEILPASRGR
jgi:hypothetical protein